jgi:hypothetical protein
MPLNKALSAFRKVGVARDNFWSGVWWTRLRRHLKERQLSRVLKKAGEDSMVARIASERYRRLEDGVTFWRPSSPLVIKALKAGERAGLPLMDLRLMALNRDIGHVENSIKVRRTWWEPALGYIALLLIISHWAFLSSLVVFSSSPWAAKCVGIFVITLIYWFLWPGFDLYTTRAYAAFKRSGEKLEAVAKSVNVARAKVLSIPPRLDQN